MLRWARSAASTPARPTGSTHSGASARRALRLKIQNRGYGELVGGNRRRVLDANRDTVVSNGGAGALEDARVFELDGRLMIYYTLPCGRSGAISTDMSFIRHHERTAWLVAHCRVVNRNVARRDQARTGNSRDRRHPLDHALGLLDPLDPHRLVGGKRQLITIT